MSTARGFLGALLSVGIVCSVLGGILSWLGVDAGPGTSPQFVVGWALIAIGALCVISLIVIGETIRRAKPHKEPPPRPLVPPPVPLPKDLKAPPPGHTWVVTVRENTKRGK